MLASRGFLSIVLVVIGAGTASASSLSGSTLCGSDFMVGATVHALRDSTQADAGTSTTDGSGQYSLTLVNGVYDLVVTPPSGSRCVTTTIQNRPVNGDTPFDIILSPQSEPPPPDHVIISGHVVINGVGAPDAGVLIYTHHFSNVETTTTDATGYFAFEVDIGTAWGLQTGVGASDGTPSVSFFVTERGYGASVDYDLEATTTAVSGTARDAVDQSPLEGLGVSVSSSFGTDTYTCNSSASTTTDALGAWGPVGVLASASGNAQTSENDSYLSGSADFTTPSSGSVTDVVIAVPLRPPPQVAVISGHFTTTAGAPIANAGVILYTHHFSQVFSASTDDAGFYSFSVPANNYGFQIGNSGPGDDGIPSSLNCSIGEQPFANGPRTIDFTVPVGSVEGIVRFADNGDLVSGATVSVNAQRGVGEGLCNTSASVVSDGDGAFAPVLFLGDADGSASVDQVAPLYAGGSSTFHVPSDDVVATTVELARYQAPPVYNLKGVFSVSGQPWVSASVLIFTRHFSTSFSMATGDDGAYLFSDVPPNSYTVQHGGDASPYGGPTSLSCTDGTYSIDTPGDTVVSRDVTGFVHLSGKVTTEAGIPIAGVTASANSSDATGCSASANLVTGDDGSYSFVLVPGSASYSFTPPSGSGYKTLDFNLPLPGDREQQIVLQLPDIVAPTLLGPPDVIHESNTSVSIQFTTNEATSGHVVYELGAAIDGSALPLDQIAFTTDHVFTLTGLLPHHDYVFQVTAKDPSNNAVSSGVIAFTTFDLPDKAPPVILSGPSITFLAPTTISVAWRTDEPASTRVDYALAATPDQTLGHVDVAGTALLHQVTLDGLTPGVAYKLTVQSTDPDLNGPVFGAPLTATTPLESDTTAPVISGLRTECVTDTAMGVCWETDEPADSSLAYERTDNHVTTQLARDGLVTTRCLGLDGLSASTQYRITVASADGGGTIGTTDPLVATTTADASVGAPAISALTAHYDSPTLARVTWTTDGPASSAVRWGTSPGALTGFAGDGSAADKTHVVFINELPTGTTIYVAAVSTNPCHQTTTSAATLVIDVDQCATANGGCDQHCVEHNPGFECTCDNGFVLAGDRHTCVSLGTCGGDSACDPDDDTLVFYGVVNDDAGNAVGSFRCERDPDDGDITCDTDEDGYLDVSDVLWCE